MIIMRILHVLLMHYLSFVACFVTTTILKRLNNVFSKCESIMKWTCIIIVIMFSILCNHTSNPVKCGIRMVTLYKDLKLLILLCRVKHHINGTSGIAVHKLHNCVIIQKSNTF